MRHFHSYGPVEPQDHFYVPRTELIERCIGQLIGNPDKGGHFFTIWSPRQTGKTWIMRRARDEIRARYGDRFTVTVLTLQGLMKLTEPEEVFLRNIPGRIQEALGVTLPPLSSFEDWRSLFLKAGGLFDRPMILLIDEFDSLAPHVIDSVAGMFRQIYLMREAYHLHGLALIGVRGVMGVKSQRGSPFNVQRSLQVPNLTRDEVTDLFRQYQQESGQSVEPEVVSKVYDVSRGQPGLVGWFGELLTEKYNPAASGSAGPIAMKDWHQVYAAAVQIEPNNTVLNLLQKARDHLTEVTQLFSRADVPFSFGQPWCNHLYMNGVLDYEQTVGDDGLPFYVCRFSSPFVQLRLYTDLSSEMDLDRRVPALDPRDDLTDVFSRLDLPALLSRYRDYLRRLKARGISPWSGQPRRADLHITEAVGHFHLYWWLIEASRRHLTISPEFPTGNGKVDLHVRGRGQAGVIEVKSYTQRSDLPEQREQAARYAGSKQLQRATLALFVPTDDEDLIKELSREDTLAVDGTPVVVNTVAIAAA